MRFITCRRDGNRRPGRCTVAALIGGLALLAVGSGAGAAPANSVGTDSEIASRLAHACSATMGLSPGTLDYADCVASLKASANGVVANRALQQSRADCAAAGPEGTPAFALCVLDREQARR